MISTRKVALSLLLTSFVTVSAAMAQSTNAHAISLYNLGLNAYKQGSPESAIIFFKRACDIDPNLADAQYNLGVLYQSQKRLKEAVPRLQEVLRVKPNDPDAHYQLGLALVDLGRGQEARQHLASIAPSNPHFPDAQRKMSQIDSQPAGQSAAADTPVASPTQPAARPWGQPATTNTPQQSGAQSGVQSYNPASSATGNMPPEAPPINRYAPPATTYSPPATTYSPPATTYSPPATTYSPPQTQTPAYNPAQTQSQTNSYNAAQAAQSTNYAQTSQATSAPSAPPSAVSVNPVPVLANSSVRVIATGFSAPAGLAFDRQGNLYVANFLSNSVDRISPDGTRTQFSSGANLKGPIGLVVDDHNNVYVANYNGGTVARINAAGVSTIIATSFKKPYYLTLDRDGNLFVSQQEDNSIVRVTLPANRPATPIGARPTP